MFRQGLAAVAAILIAQSAAADPIGKAEYDAACASCHGESGKGDGPLAQHMTLAVPDLTGIAARNDGRFPMLDVIHIIDGRTGLRGHGYPMPVWGDRFAAEFGPSTGSYSAETLVRGRILSVVYYLEELQQ